MTTERPLVPDETAAPTPTATAEPIEEVPAMVPTEAPARSESSATPVAIEATPTVPALIEEPEVIPTPTPPPTPSPTARPVHVPLTATPAWPLEVVPNSYGVQADPAIVDRLPLDEDGVVLWNGCSEAWNRYSRQYHRNVECYSRCATLTSPTTSLADNRKTAVREYPGAPSGIRTRGLHLERVAS